MRRIGVVTTSRADYGLYRPILRAIEADPTLKLELYVSGMHLVPAYGETVAEIEADSFPIAERLSVLLADDSPGGISKSVGVGVMGFAEVFTRARPDLLLVLGDRFEMFSAPLAALPFRIPVAHLYGGELTEGALDDALRHSITKLSHLHFVSTARYAQRVIQLGEAPWRVHTVGTSSLDNLREMQFFSRDELAAQLGLSLEVAPLVVTFHPVTLAYEQTDWHIAELLAALAEASRPLVFTAPNADTHGWIIIEALRAFVADHPRAVLVDSLGTRGYFSLMHHAAAMVGNSSSGIVEAASFELPVVNIGTRQSGRVRGPNVIDCDYDRAAIRAAIAQALAPEFRAGWAGLDNPYGDEGAAQRIVAVLREVSLDERLLIKRFHDL